MLLVIYTRLDTISECIISNARHAIGDGDRGKAGAATERIISNARHTIGDGDGGKARAIRERMISNARHAVADGDGGKAKATHVFVIHSFTIGILNFNVVGTRYQRQQKYCE